ncbi:SCO7613 C-terminal domain-containing membrane protein [Nocardiopsis sp. NPDC057823]|uniref:SCO7613 C-terminal domain-containing membrane protein n=1 Tax=Nocardiopsis sp. NPDC057823 TaxID=3346256 RepID=UPI00366C252D
MDVNASPPPAAGPSLRCPDCRSPLAAGSAACARCGLLLTGPLAQRLWEVDTEIGRADEHLRRLRSERSGLLHALRAASRRAAAVPPAAGPVPPAAHPAAVPAAAPHAAVPPRPDGEMRRRSAQNVILGLGGLLVGISALVFAIWTWSDMGTGTRALVLGATTLAFALVAVPLYRRGLQATAETFGVLAAVLLGIDALALWLLMPERLPEGPGYSAGALAGIAALTALYPLLVPLRAPRIIAALAAQPVPLLLLFALPLDDPFPWILPVLAATGLADLVLARVTAPLGEHAPRRTLTVLSVVLAVLTAAVSALLVFAVTEADPPGWWGPALALLLSGATWLVLARDRANGRIAALPAVAALVLVPLAAGPAVLPVLPRPPAGEPWSLRSADVPATTVLGVDGPGTAWPESLPYLAAIAVGAALAAGVTALLRRDLLPTVAFLAAPPVLLAPPLLLGLPHPVAVAWALCLGGLLVLGTAAIPARPYAWASAAAGVATLVTALLWSAGLFWTFMAALPCVGLVALAALLLLRHRFPGFGAPAAPVPPGTAVPVPPGRVLYGAALALWAVGLPAWASAWAALGAGVMPAQGSWWTAAAILLSGVTALLLGRTSPRPAVPGAPDARTAFTVFGLLLLPLALVLAPPGGALWSGGTSLEVWSAPPEVMLEPATEVLGTAVAVGPGTAAGLLVAGALAVALVGAVDRRWLLPAAALAAPPALVPLPVMLGAPFAVAVLWAAAVGALLALGAALVRDRLAWAPAVTGPLTLAAALYWSLPEQHTTLLVVLLSAGAALGCALLSRRAAAPRHPAEARALPPVPTAGPVAGTAGAAPGIRIGTAFGAALGTGFPAAAAWALCLAGAAGAETGVAAWWLLAAVPVLLGATALVLGEGTDALPLTAVGLLLGGAAPLVAGTTAATALVPVSWNHGVAAAGAGALLDPAYVFLGLGDRPDPLVALGVVAAGAAAVGAASLAARRWTGHTAALAVPPALVPVAVLVGAPFAVALAVSVAVGAGLALWSALSRDRSFSWLPGLTGLLVLAQALGWALAERYATIAVLLAVAALGSAVAAPARTVPPAVAATAAATAATGGFAFTLALALGAPAEYAALAPIALVAGVAAAAPRMRSPLVEAAEVPAALWAAVSVAVAAVHGAHGGITALALAVVGVIALATAVRPERRWAAAVGALLMLAALWTALAAWDVTVPEAYTVLPALAALVVGWEWTRKAERTPSSWASLSGGLCLLLLPGLGMVLAGEDTLWRVPALLAAALAVVLWGLRRRSQAALVIGGLTLLGTALRAFGPPLWDLTRLLPNWVPFAVIGALLLLIGARYEASLERVRRLGHFIGGMR